MNHMESTHTPNILIVEDDERLATLTKEYLENNGLSVSIEADGATRRFEYGPAFAHVMFILGSRP